MLGLFGQRQVPVQVVIPPEQDQDPDEEQMSKMKKRREKQKKKKDGIEFTLISRKRKVKKQPSEIVKAVNELIKNGYNTSDKIASYFLTEKSKSLSNAAKNMYTALVTSKVYADNVRLTDTITNKPLHCYYFIKTFKTKTLSNDSLWLNLLARKSYSNASDKLKNLYNISSIYSAWFGSKAVEYSNQKILKGYYQDFSDSFAMIGANGLLEEEKVAILNAEKFNFEDSDIKYTAVGDSNKCIIYKSTLNADEVKDLIKKTVEISSTDSGFSLNEKKIEMKKEVFKYVDCKVKPEVFCPAFLIMPNEQEYSVIIKFDVDYNKLFLLFDKYTINGNIDVNSNLFYWDTMEQFFDFIAIYIVTSKANNENAKKKLKSIYDTYVKLKPIIELWKGVQIKFQKILHTFYYAFAGKINYDKLDFLYKKVNEYIIDRDRLKKEENYDEISELFRSCPLCTMIGNQFSDEVFGIADTMRSAIDNLMIGGINIIKQLRQVGVLIYNVSLCAENDENSKVAFPFGVAFGSFLGNLWYKGRMNVGALAANAENLRDRIQVNREQRERRVEQDYQDIQKIDQNVLSAIGVFISTRETALGYKLGDNALKELGGIVFNMVKNDKNFNDAIRLEIFKALRENRNANIQFPQNIIDKINNYIDTAKNNAMSEILNAQRAVNERQKELNNAQNNLNNIQNKSAFEPKVPVAQQGVRPGDVNDEIDIDFSGGEEEKKEEREDEFDEGPLVNLKARDLPVNSASGMFKFYLDNNQIDPDAKGSPYAQFYGDVLYLSGLDPKMDQEAGKYLSLRALIENYGGLKYDLIDAVSKLYRLDFSNLSNYRSKKITRGKLVFDDDTVSYVNNNPDATLVGTIQAKQDAMRQAKQVAKNA